MRRIVQRPIKNIGVNGLMVIGLILVMTSIRCDQWRDGSGGALSHPSSGEAIDVEIVNDTAETQQESVPKSTEERSSFKPFYIYADKSSRQNHFTPSGFMPDGRCLALDDAWTEGCYKGKTCIKITYDVACSRDRQKWVGIYWLHPPNNWGQRKGGFNLTGARKLTFWARGERGGEQIQEVTTGGITGNYPDTDTAVIGPIILSSEWRQYTIDLRGKDLSYISGGFAWTTSEDVNKDPCVFYLDEIRFE